MSTRENILRGGRPLPALGENFGSIFLLQLLARYASPEVWRSEDCVCIEFSEVRSHKTQEQRFVVDTSFSTLASGFFSGPETPHFPPLFSKR